MRSLSISERPSIQEANETSRRAGTRNEYMRNTAHPPPQFILEEASSAFAFDS